MEKENKCANRQSVLPLVFAGGYPTSLEKITEPQLEKFIPFMIKCSLGNIQKQINEYSKPEWWPESVPFSIPLRGPTYGTDWLEKLKSIVKMCYDFHGDAYFLELCHRLGEYKPESLRFIGHSNNTTSLYERSSNKLLVTVRNANLLYDQASVDRTSKMTLMPTKKKKSFSEFIHDTVETVFEIYLCDNCEAELYSQDAYDEHEKAYHRNDQDVIHSGDEFLTDTLDNTFEEQATFLANFSLGNPKLPLPSQLKTPVKKCVDQSTIIGVKRKHRKVVYNGRVPFSSPLGQQLLNSFKGHLATSSYAMGKIKRTERYCHAPPITSNNSDIVIQPIKDKCIPVTYRSPAGHTYRQYTFPRRQFSQHRHRQAVLKLTNDKLKKCERMSLELMKLSTNGTGTFNSDNRYEQMTKNDVMSTIQQAIVIDLCSDDDNGGDFSNSDINSEHQHFKCYSRYLNGVQGSTVSRKIGDCANK